VKLGGRGTTDHYKDREGLCRGGGGPNSSILKQRVNWEKKERLSCLFIQNKPDSGLCSGKKLEERGLRKEVLKK